MDVLIVGAGGFGREISSWAEDTCRATSPGWRVAGFLDDDDGALDGFDHPLPVLGPVRDHRPRAGELFLLAVGSPRVKLELAGVLSERGARFLTLVHPTSVVARGATLGEGSVLCPYSCATADARLGRWVTVNVHASVAHDTEIGDGSTLSGHCDVTGGAKLGRGVFMGSHAVVLPGVEVGELAYVGAGSVVTRTVRPGITVFGVPARQISPDGTRE
jgi:sugar O-acyltransferase (sialic acid O-acetyltransferase NeuD family)